MKPADRINSVQWWNDYFREEWERHGGPEQSRHFMQRIVDQLPPLDRAFLAEQAWSILDWGCAFGDGTAELARAFPRATVYGIEISSTALSRAAERFAGIRFLRATDDAPVGTLPRAFEVVVNSNSLEHFADPLDVLRRNLAATTMLHLSLVPYDEAPLSVHHLTRFDESWFPEVIDGFDRVLAKVVDVDPTYWPGGRQLLVAYASRAYRTQRCAFERGFDERLKWDNYYRELPLLEIDPQTQAFNDELVQLVRELLPQGGRILEAGCGGGNQSLALAQSGYEVTLLDFSGAALEYARRSFEKHSVRATYVQDDAFAQRAAEYDLVFNAGVLEHYTLEEQARFLRGMASRSRRYVLALIPNRGCYWYWLWRIKKAAAGDWPFGKEVPQTTLADAFDAAGLTYAGETYLGAAWSESFIESLDGIDEQSRRLLIRLHRSPIVPGISKGYLLAALGVVAGTAAPWATLTPARLSTGDIRRHEEWAAALADALAGTIAAENRVRSERLRSEAELDAARGAAREEIAARDRRLIEVQATLEAHVAEARAQNGQTEQKLAASQLETAAVRSDLAAARSLIEQLQMQLQQFSVELHAVHSSRGWRFILFVRRLRQRFLPRGSRREWLARKLFRAARAGLKSLRKAPKTPLSTAATAAQPPVEAAPPSLAAASGPNAPVELPPPDYRPPLRQYAVIVLPIIDFTFRFQRPQQLATQFAAAGHPVFYAAMTFAGATSVRRLAAGIDSVILGGPAANPYRDVLADDVAATMAADLLRLIRLRGVESSVCIVQLPFWAPLAKALRAQGRTPIVYDCMDDHAGFSTNTDEMTRLEAPLVADADLCVGSSQLLHDRLTAAGARTILVRNAADHAHFAAVPWRRCDDLDSAVIGYYGAIADWFDAALVAQIARLRPQWTIKLIGSTFSADLAPLQGLGNVELVGEQPYARLPELIENWSCCLIPFRRNPLTEATNPVKVYEMLAAGKPVVAVALPELAPLSAAGLVRLGATAEEFVAAIENEMRTDNESAVARRRAFAAANTWSDRYALLDREVRALFPLVSVVVVTYNNERMNRLCLDSLLRDTDWPNLEVIVVDNASSDGTPALLREFAQTDPRVKVILNDANLGFAAGNNVGANAAQGEYLCLLNNDTIVTGGWLSRLIEHLRVRPDLGLVGPVTNAIGNEAQIAISYAGVSELPAWADRWCAAHRGQLVDVPMLAFFCVALRRSVWHQIGGLDERFGKGMFEDDDYNRRIRAAGLRVQLARDSFVHHWQKASFRLLGEQEYLRIYHENRRRFRIKWSEPNEAPADVAHKLAPLRQRAAAGKGTVVFPPSVGWSIDLFQRPHHLARVLAQDGYAVVFDCSTSYDSVDVIKQIEPGLFLFKGESEWLAGLPNLILWTFSYNYDYRDRYPERARVIYDWIDDLKVFPYDQEVLRELHARAMKEADVVAAVARPLHELALKERADAIYLPNAVEAARFEREPTPNAARSDPALTTVLASGKPIAGYYGALAAWFDYPLLIATAKLRPDWEFVLIGPDYDQSIAAARLSQCANITWLGPRKYHELPGYLHLFDVATIPFRINEITIATSPLKLYEYFAGGKAVIASAMPECAALPKVHIVRDANEFSRALDAALTAGPDPAHGAALREIAAANTWHARVELAISTLGQKFAPVPAAPPAATAIESRFGSLRTPRNHHFFSALVRHFSAIQDDPCLTMYFEFALSANDRGRSTASELEKLVRLTGKRYLDVGCAYGGFLIAFGEKGARPVVGIDINPALLDLARENFKDAGHDYDVRLLDVTKPQDVAGLGGPFDIITCNDVIEHVADPALATRHIADLLAADGIAYFEVPNRDAVCAVEADGHYRIFGITLFDRDEACAYFARLRPAIPYTVEHYLRLDEYRAMFNRAGLDLEVMLPTLTGSDFDETRQSLARLRSERHLRLRTVPPEWRSRVQSRLDEYLKVAAAADTSSASARREYVLRYGTPYWRILARKRHELG